MRTQPSLLIRARFSGKISCKTRSNRRVIHDIMKRRGFFGHHSQLLRLFLRENSRSKFRFRWSIFRFDLCFVSRVNVIGIRRPAEERRPPFPGRGFPGNVVGVDGVTDNEGRSREEIGRHCWGEERELMGFWFCVFVRFK